MRRLFICVRVCVWVCARVCVWVCVCGCVCVVGIRELSFLRKLNELHTDRLVHLLASYPTLDVLFQPRVDLRGI